MRTHPTRERKARMSGFQWTMPEPVPKPTKQKSSSGYFKILTQIPWIGVTSGFLVVLALLFVGKLVNFRSPGEGVLDEAVSESLEDETVSSQLEARDVGDFPFKKSSLDQLFDDERNMDDFRGETNPETVNRNSFNSFPGKSVNGETEDASLRSGLKNRGSGSYGSETYSKDRERDENEYSKESVRSKLPYEKNIEDEDEATLEKRNEYSDRNSDKNFPRSRNDFSSESSQSFRESLRNDLKEESNRESTATVSNLSGFHSKDKYSQQHPVKREKSRVNSKERTFPYEEETREKSSFNSEKEEVSRSLEKEKKTFSNGDELRKRFDSKNEKPLPLQEEIPLNSNLIGNSLSSSSSNSQTNLFTEKFKSSSFASSTLQEDSNLPMKSKNLYQNSLRDSSELLDNLNSQKTVEEEEEDSENQRREENFSHGSRRDERVSGERDSSLNFRQSEEDSEDLSSEVSGNSNDFRRSKSEKFSNSDSETSFPEKRKFPEESHKTYDESLENDSESSGTKKYDGFGGDVLRGEHGEMTYSKSNFDHGEMTTKSTSSLRESSGRPPLLDEVNGKGSSWRTRVQGRGFEESRDSNNDDDVATYRWRERENSKGSEKNEDEDGLESLDEIWKKLVDFSGKPKKRRRFRIEEEVMSADGVSKKSYEREESEHGEKSNLDKLWEKHFARERNRRGSGRVQDSDQEDEREKEVFGKRKSRKDWP